MARLVPASMPLIRHVPHTFGPSVVGLDERRGFSDRSENPLPPAEDRGFELLRTPWHRATARRLAGCLTCADAATGEAVKHGGPGRGPERVASAVAWKRAHSLHRVAGSRPSVGSRGRPVGSLSWLTHSRRSRPVGSVGSVGSTAPSKTTSPRAADLQLSQLSRLSQLVMTSALAGGCVEPTVSRLTSRLRGSIRYVACRISIGKCANSSPADRTRST